MTKSTQPAITTDEAAHAALGKLIDESINEIADELVQLAGIVVCVKHALDPLTENLGEIDDCQVMSAAGSAQQAATHIEARLCDLAYSLTNRVKIASRLAEQITATNREAVGHA